MDAFEQCWFPYGYNIQILLSFPLVQYTSHKQVIRNNVVGMCFLDRSAYGFLTP